ncbi:MAG: TPM domain-containing protein [Proteobacteria bacterium]|nr:TPM domain-containing protein [Pseudomonadota bacterium]NOG61685.1 TPM domain-containing protein [Pseudomonadota bacterium]
MNKQRQQWILLAAAFLIIFSNLAYSKPSFPKLTGRVVDNAKMLGSSTEKRLTDQLAAHENATTNQVVVVTLLNLGGYDIDTYGYQLGRKWGIGQKNKNNGVLLIVAKKERKVRIEVGYGLEGTLTDAISANIINSVIVPYFKKAQFEKGIEQGVSSIINALGGKYKMKTHKRSKSDNDPLGIIFMIIFLLFWGWGFLGGITNGRYGGSYGSGGFSSGGGGFSGGGGSFGGGGASGGW